MTTQIISHNFQNANPTAARVMLTAPVLSGGRRLFKAANKFGTALHAACIFLCGLCTAVSLTVLIILATGG